MIPFQVICCFAVALFHVVGVIAVITVMTVSAVILVPGDLLFCCCSVSRCRCYSCDNCNDCFGCDTVPSV